MVEVAFLRVEEDFLDFFIIQQFLRSGGCFVTFRKLD